MPLFKKDPIEEEMSQIAILMAYEEAGSEERQTLQDRYMELEKHRLEVKKTSHEWLPFLGRLAGVVGTVGLGLLTMRYEDDHILTGHSIKWWLGRKMD